MHWQVDVSLQPFEWVWSGVVALGTLAAVSLQWGCQGDGGWYLVVWSRLKATPVAACGYLPDKNTRDTYRHIFQWAELCRYTICNIWPWKYRLALYSLLVCLTVPGLWPRITGGNHHESASSQWTQLEPVSEASGDYSEEWRRFTAAQRRNNAMTLGRTERSGHWLKLYKDKRFPQSHLSLIWLKFFMMS